MSKVNQTTKDMEDELSDIVKLSPESTRKRDLNADKTANLPTWAEAVKKETTKDSKSNI